MKELPKRPEYCCDEVLKLVARDLAPAVAKWAKQSTASIEPDLLLALETAWNLDGYQLARELGSWEPDSTLVSILDRAGRYHMDRLVQLQRNWVRDNEVTLTKEVGDLVAKVCGPWCFTGVVRGLDRTTAMYVVDKYGLGVNPMGAAAGELVHGENVKEGISWGIQ